MAKKIYLSAAAHQNDNPTKCPGGKCGENIHCNAYMDIVEKRLKALGFSVKRGDKSKKGGPALQSRVAEANKWGAYIYYVAHTNSDGKDGKTGANYSMTMHYPDDASKKKAEVFHKYRKCVPSHKVNPRSDLYEIKATAMPCMYDELFFHDNAEQCKWFHNGGIEKMAEEAVQALCELCGVTYKAATAEKTESKKETAKKDDAPKAGDTIVLKKGKLYLSSTGKSAVTRTGTFYLYDGKKVNGRYRVTNKASRVGKKPLGLYVSGWVVL